MRNKYYTIDQFRHGKWRVLDRWSMDVTGEYMTKADARRLAMKYNYKLAVTEPMLNKLIVANMLPAERVSVAEVENVLAGVVEYAETADLRLMVKDSDYLKECITAIIYQS